MTPAPGRLDTKNPWTLLESFDESYSTHKSIETPRTGINNNLSKYSMKHPRNS